MLIQSFSIIPANEFVYLSNIYLQKVTRRSKVFPTHKAGYINIFETEIAARAKARPQFPPTAHLGKVFSISPTPTTPTHTVYALYREYCIFANTHISVQKKANTSWEMFSISPTSTTTYNLKQAPQMAQFAKQLI